MTRRTQQRSVVAVVGTLMVAVLAAPAAGAQARGTTVRVSASLGGRAGNADSFAPAVSGDGTLVAFSSSASNLVRGDTNGADDIFVRDVARGRTTRVSLGDGGAEANGNSEAPAISADGRVVAFESSASNLVAGDTNNAFDVFVRDRVEGTTKRVSVATGGRQGNGNSLHPSVSADGRFVAFESDAPNLVPGDSNNATDVFVYDRSTGTTTRISEATGGRQATGGSFEPAISRDGRFVAFSSDAFNLVRGDTNGLSDVFVRDRSAGTTTRVSVATGGGEASGGTLGTIGIVAISADGQVVGFQSDASNLVPGDTNGATDGFVHDRRSGTTTRVSVATGGAQGTAGGGGPSLSADGRLVAFTSFSDNLVSGDANAAGDVFVRDLRAGTTVRVSIGATGTEGNATSAGASISANGRLVAFSSEATNLVDREPVRINDIFARS